MRIRMKTLAAGPLATYRPGEVADVDAATAQAFIDGGYAEAVEQVQAVRESVQETAMLQAPERAVMPKAKARGRK